MTEAVGASALMADVPAAEPMAPSREQAFGKLDAMQKDAGFQRRIIDGDSAALAELKATRAVVNSPSGLQVMVREDSTPEARERVAGAWSDFANLSPEILQQAKDRPPISEDEYRYATAEKRRLFADREWVKRYFDGDRDARTKMATLSILLSSEIRAK